MCGIAGYAGIHDDPLLRRMCGSLAHRGPDDEGYYATAEVGLSMRRLAVIDLATGMQPIANEGKDVWVVFNGEIYNYDDIRKSLAERGHVLSTKSDTETIVHLYEDHGLDFVEHLRGMFAIGLWDERRKRLILVRDRIGEKPLFYAVKDRSALLRFGNQGHSSRVRLAQRWILRPLATFCRQGMWLATGRSSKAYSNCPRVTCLFGRMATLPSGDTGTPPLKVGTTYRSDLLPAS